MTAATAKLTKMTINGVHVGWQSQDRTITVEKIDACSGGGWTVVRAAASNINIPPIVRTLADARVCVAEILTTRTEGQAADDRAALARADRCAAAAGYHIA